MPITESQKLDMLWKKVMFRVAETDAINKIAQNESIPTHVNLLNDDIWTDSSLIPIPAAELVNVTASYLVHGAARLVMNKTVSEFTSWYTVDAITGEKLDGWIPPSIDPSYMVTVYNGDLSSNPTGGILNPFATGHEWIFDYESGVLYFPNSVPVGIDTISLLWITGYRYIGRRGVVLNDNNVYTNSAPVPTSIGGINAGQTFLNMSMQDMFTNLLYPYQYPKFTAFTMNGQTTTLEVGDSITGTHTFSWTTNNVINIMDNSTRIVDSNTGQTIMSLASANGSYNYNFIPTVRLTSSGTYTWTISANNTKNGVFSSSFSVNWQYKVYYGESVLSNLAAFDVVGLRLNTLTSTMNSTYNYQGGGYKYVCYPSVFGAATHFTDKSTNLNIPFLQMYQVQVTSAFGIVTTYNVHRSLNVLGGAISIILS